MGEAVELVKKNRWKVKKTQLVMRLETFSKCGEYLGPQVGEATEQQRQWVRPLRWRPRSTAGG